MALVPSVDPTSHLGGGSGFMGRRAERGPTKDQRVVRKGFICYPRPTGPQAFFLASFLLLLHRRRRRNRRKIPTVVPYCICFAVPACPSRARADLPPILVA